MGSHGRFRQIRATDILGEVLQQRVKGLTYQPDLASSQARELADEIKGRLKGIVDQFYRALKDKAIRNA